MARHAGFEGFELIDAPVIDGHPRVIGTLRADSFLGTTGRGFARPVGTPSRLSLPSGAEVAPRNGPRHSASRP